MHQLSTCIHLNPAVLPCTFRDGEYLYRHPLMLSNITLPDMKTHNHSLSLKWSYKLFVEVLRRIQIKEHITGTPLNLHRLPKHRLIYLSDMMNNTSYCKYVY